MTVKTIVDFGDLLQIHTSNANGDWIRPKSCFFFFFFALVFSWYQYYYLGLGVA